MSVELSAPLLQDVLGRVLQEMAFVFAEPSPTPLQWPARVVTAELSYSGPGAGTLRLTTTSELALLIAENLIGMDAGAPQSERPSADALGEVLNIAGGLLVAEVFGQSELSQLTSPRVERRDAEVSGQERMRSLCRVRMLAEDEFPVELAAYAEVPGI